MLFAVFAHKKKTVNAASLYYKQSLGYSVFLLSFHYDFKSLCICYLYVWYNQLQDHEISRNIKEPIA